MLIIHTGDTVTIYLPMTWQAVVAFLACARIGAIHSAVFAGFSAESLRDRWVLWLFAFLGLDLFSRQWMAVVPTWGGFSLRVFSLVVPRFAGWISGRKRRLRGSAGVGIGTGTGKKGIEGDYAEYGPTAYLSRLPYGVISTACFADSISLAPRIID